MKFTTADYERVAAAVRRAEEKTSGEIVCALARRSSDYAYVPPLWAAFIALVAPWPMALLTDLSTKAIYATQIAIFILSVAVISWPPLRFALTPRLVKRTRAHRAAIEQFYMLGVAGTKGRTGVLIFVSVAEHYARIIADDGLSEKISDEEWRAALEPLLACMREGRCADGYVAAVEKCARLLALHAPPGAQDNELPDKIHLT